jgi:hypothetical protein
MTICKVASLRRKRKPSVLRSNAPLGPRLRGDDDARDQRLCPNVRSVVPAQAGSQRLSLERATGPPPSQGRRRSRPSVFARTCVPSFPRKREPSVFRSNARTCAPSFPRKRNPSVFRSNAPLGPRLRGDDDARDPASLPELALRRSRGSGNPASFARTPERALRRSRGSGNPASFVRTCAPAFPRKREPSVVRSNAPRGPRLRGDDDALGTAAFRR